WRFERRSPQNPSHPHTLCMDCGRVECLEGLAPQSLAEILPQGFSLAEVVFRGRCADCTGD
ncbi:MAG: transcriptional repressor, partial [Planctomycetaceae bacterium]|nr:transcriptional repressor [Planctomycetaceae bacterium]